jgi:DNA primase
MAKRKSIPFKKVVEQVDLIDACEHLGIKLKKSGKSYRGQCPECDNKRMAVTPGEGFNCHRCDVQGHDAIALVKYHEGLSGMYDAAAYLVDAFDLDFENSNGTRRSKKKSTVSEKRERTVPAKRGSKSRKKLDPLTAAMKVAARLDHEHELVGEMGLEPDEAEQLSVGYAKSGVLAGHVGILIRDENGNPLRYFAAEAGYFCSEFEGSEAPPTNVVPLRKPA